ncbi:MAG: AAA family ATPase [Candidatus Sumerlaeota bacterium]|nr:AAA family ATPase [Candidatus Sumerlaeota bacterium]
MTPPRKLSLSVRGFKSICTEQQLEIRPLTLLAGANSSGKSSMMQPLLLIKQTLEAPYDPGALLLDGPNVRFTSSNQLLSRLGNKIHVDTFALRIQGKDFNELVFSKSASKGFDIESMSFSARNAAVTLTPKMKRAEIIKAFSSSYLPHEFKKYWKMEITRERCLLSFLIEGLPARNPLHYFTTTDYLQLASHLLHLPGLRGNPERTYKTTAISDRFPGTFDAYTASVIDHWKSSKSEKMVQISDNLKFLELTCKVDVKRLDDTRVELYVGRTPQGKRNGASDMVSVADVGVGVSQTLPVLVALLAANPGQMVFLEQPEIHLHPRAQRRMAYILAEAAKRGVIVIAETHSSLLVREVQTMVAKGDIAPDLVKLNWFRRSEKDGGTEVIPADLDENGAFGDWPEDFDEVALESENDYLTAVEKRSAGK